MKVTCTLQDSNFLGLEKVTFRGRVRPCNFRRKTKSSKNIQKLIGKLLGRILASIKHQASSICFAICFVTNQHTTEVEALLTRQISIICRRASCPHLEIFRLPYFRFKKMNLNNKLVLKYRRKVIKVFWGDPGQNGWFWEPFLIHWNCQNLENVEFGRFGIINPVQHRLVSIRTVFRSLQNH